MARKVVVSSRKRVFDNHFKVDAATVSFEGYDGRMRGPMERLSFERGDAVGALVLDRDTDEIILVEQFKFPTYATGPGWIVETMAGMIDEGETPEEALKREMEEEIGYRTSDFEHIVTYYPSAGGSSERVFLFYAEVTAADKTGSGGGLASENEDIRIVRLPRGEFLQNVRDCNYIDSKILVAGFWLITRQPRPHPEPVEG